MTFDTPTPFDEAANLLAAKRLLPTVLDTRQLQQIDAGIRRRALFSAKVTDARFLQDVRNLLDTIISPEGRKAGEYMNKAKFREVMADYLKSIGYTAAPDKVGTIEDLATDQRLNVIADTNAKQLRGFGQYIQQNDPATLDAWPALELFRLEPRDEPRDWPFRWRTAGGQFFGAGRMIALKDDPIWVDISAFGNPYPPFDFGSGMWTREISLEECIRLGVMDRGEEPPQANARMLDFYETMNGSVESDITQLDPDLTDALMDGLGSLATLLNGVLRLKGI